MVLEFDSPGVLTAKYLFGLAGTGVCSFIIVQILFNIELNEFKRSVAPEVEKNLSELTLSSTNSDDDDFGNESFQSSPNQSVIRKSLSHDSNKSEDSYIRKKRIHKETKMGIFLNVFIVTFVNYLLLVYLPSGLAPSLIAMVVLSCILLRAQLIEDLRRRRFDRISTIFSLLIFMASFLSLCTYATVGRKEGGVYEGPARIVGYDVTNYNNEDQSALRTDLEVEWGGVWGCPDTPQKQCHAYVSGALCEVSEDLERNLDATEDYYKELITYQEDFVEEEKEIVEETAEENDLEYAEVLQDTDNIIQDESNTTENEIDAVEMNITETSSEVTADVTTAEEEVANGTISAEVVEEEAKDVTALEKEVADLEKQVLELEEQNVEEEEMNEITVAAEEYYAVADQEATNSTEELETENEELSEDVKYYKEVTSEVENENEGLEDANEDIAMENEILEDEVDEVIDYYQEKEASETTTEKVITIKYYPVNGTDPDGNYNVSVTETEEEVPATDNNSGAYASTQSMADDEKWVDDYGYMGYGFEDDYFEDKYWSYDWGAAWGDYACNDLFDTDLEGDTYDEDVAPGGDSWPYVTIYGSCNSCKAFLVDYYSTEHFDKIKKYQKHAVTYAVFGFASMIVTGALMLKQWLRPAQGNQIDLLMSDGGQFA
jgi:hypothetical protein